MTLLAHYKLNEAAGTSGANSVLDASGNGYHGTPAGCTFNQEGRIDKAVSLNGTSHAIDCGDVEALKLNAFTLAAWVSSGRAATNSTYYWYIAQRGSVFDAGYGIHFYDRYLAGTQGFEVWLRGSSLKTCRAENTYNTLSGWNHVCGVHDGSEYLSIYINGSYVTRTATAGVTPSTAANNFRIGDDDRTSEANGLLWSGAIDDVRIYNTALTAAQISAIYNGGSGTEAAYPWLAATKMQHYRRLRTQ